MIVSFDRAKNKNPEKPDKRYTNLTNFWRIPKSTQNHTHEKPFPDKWDPAWSGILLQLPAKALRMIFKTEIESDDPVEIVISQTLANPFLSDGFSSVTKEHLQKFTEKDLKLYHKHLRILGAPPIIKKDLIDEIFDHHDFSFQNPAPEVPKKVGDNDIVFDKNPIRACYLKTYNLIDHHDIFNNKIFPLHNRQGSWQTAAFWGLLAMHIVNAYVLYCECHHLMESKKRPKPLNFMRMLSTEIIEKHKKNCSK